MASMHDANQAGVGDDSTCRLGVLADDAPLGTGRDSWPMQCPSGFAVCWGGLMHEHHAACMFR